VDNSDISGSEREMTASQLRMDVKNGGAGREVTLGSVDKGMRPTHGTQYRTKGMSATEVVSDKKTGHAAHFG